MSPIIFRSPALSPRKPSRPDFGKAESRTLLMHTTNFAHRSTSHLPALKITVELCRIDDANYITELEAWRMNYVVILAQLSWPQSRLRQTDLRWIDARYQIADCLTKHASRKSEAVLQKNSARGTVENHGRRGHAGPTQTRTRDP